MDSISPISSALQTIEAQRAAAAGAANIVQGPGFAQALKGAIESVNARQVQADSLQARFQLNDPEVSLEESMIAMQTASISLQALVQVRNKLVSAYQEIMNLSV
ncbi:MAG: flagellar hook-basal body complex protein FliE [Betaproteobacteria bacterium]|nr:flagellar hook-basal body complex protein FliE [Betaproteobacteria bacterium]